MNVSINRLIFASLLSFSLCGAPLMGNAFLDAAQDQINKISPKPVVHKQPLEFKQAVARYIKNTESQCLSSQRYADENVSYKKELRYLFNNYGKFSTAALLSRLRSAHQAMVKHESNNDSDVYKRYEQISSALLLICSQVFFNDARDQILNALHEIDSLIVYWRYQHNHQVSYFFSKSPVKWITGKEQEKEIAYNLNRLERKQRELYTLLGLLTGHIHTFTESGTSYNDCYTWLEELFVVLSCIKISPSYNVDGTQFDRIAAELEAKIKRVGKLTDDFLLTVNFASKPNHFVRNWIAYTALVGATGYAMHYHTKNPEFFPAAAVGVQDSAKYLLVLLVDPLKKIYKRMETAFSPKVENEDKKDSSKTDDKNQVNEILKDEDELADFAEIPSGSSVDELCDQLKQVGKEMVSEINEELAKSNTTVREDALILLREAVQEAKSPTDGYVYSSSPYIFDEESVNEVAREKVLKRVEPIKKDGVVINYEEVTAYQETLAKMYKTIEEMSGQTPRNLTGSALKAKLAGVKFLLRLDNDYLGPLRKYTDIIDLKILKEAEIFADLGDNLGRRGDSLAKRADFLLKKADRKMAEADVMLQDIVKDVRIKLEEADATLQDNQLTFMFTSLIPLILTGAGITKTYQWTTKKNYAPIRVALADVNALLIESATQLDDHDYGKLVYLICKLRHKSKLLKSALSNEFLIDVAKLESKRYTAQTKRDIVENMFNKYAFLGRIAA